METVQICTLSNTPLPERFTDKTAIAGKAPFSMEIFDGIRIIVMDPVNQSINQSKLSLAPVPCNCREHTILSRF